LSYPRNPVLERQRKAVGQALLLLRRVLRFEEIWMEILQEGVERQMFRSADPLLVKGLLGLHNYAYLGIDPAGGRAPRTFRTFFWISRRAVC
jgi:hypothetical protein